MKRLASIVFAFLCLTGFVRSQVGNSFSTSNSITSVVNDSVALPTDNSQPWTLQQCVEYAKVHNISIQQQTLNVQMAKANLLQSEGNLLPNLNAYASHTYNYGRTVDRYTNQFADNMVLSENFYLSSQLTVFSGLQNINTIQQNRYNFQASLLGVQATANDVGMSVASAYLNVLYTDDQVTIAQKQYDLTKSQVDRAQVLVDAGAKDKGFLLDLQSQLATEEVSLVTAQNNSVIAYLTLEQLMNLDSTRGFQIVKPELTVPNTSLLTMTAESIYQAALNNQPAIKKAEMDLKSADKGVAIAYGAYSPNLSIQGSIGTGYSGASKDISGAPVYNGYDTIGVTSGGDLVYIPDYTYQYATTPFADQFNNNVNKSFGVQLNVPIFNRFQVNTAVTKAKIARENAELNVDLSQQQLFKSIQQAYADAQAAFLKYQAAQKAVDAAQASFNFTEEKFNVGAAGVGTIEYNNAKNKLAQAESDMLQAKFDYIFRMKVLDFYQGIPLTF